jgi:hypothetical protein
MNFELKATHWDDHVLNKTRFIEELFNQINMLVVFEKLWDLRSKMEHN